MCGILAELEAVRPIYEDGQFTVQGRSAAIMGTEEDICCPSCGPRTQTVSESANA